MKISNSVLLLHKSKESSSEIQWIIDVTLHLSFTMLRPCSRPCMCTSPSWIMLSVEVGIPNSLYCITYLVTECATWKWIKMQSLETYTACTVFENNRKSLIQHCEQSELRLHFEWTKVNKKCQKWFILARFWKPEACGQTVLPDRSVLIGQKLVENARIQIRHFE